MQDSLTYLFCNKFVNCSRYLFHFSWVFCKLYTVRFLYYKEKKSEVALYRSILKDFSLESWFKRETDQRPFRDLLQKHWTLFLKVLQFIISVFRERIRNWGQLAFKSESSLVCLYIQEIETVIRIIQFIESQSLWDSTRLPHLNEPPWTAKQSTFYC